MTQSGVVYLYRFAEGPAPARRFLDSYRAHPPGLDHDLHIILKGFPNRQALDAARALFGGLAIHTIELDDTGYDIGAYIAAARLVSNRVLLFLNTLSEILADDWLKHFDAALTMAGVGLVGATGSWQSVSSGYEAAALRILRDPIHYLKYYLGYSRSVFDRDADSNALDQFNARRALERLGRFSLYPLRIYQFPRYPNPHIRTNAFMIGRELFLSLQAGAFESKVDVYKFESGRNSMTRQIMARGFEPVVVDRSGRVYHISQWKSSSTFWIDLQTNLLIADNQTSSYAVGSPARRTVLTNYAWVPPSSWGK